MASMTLALVQAAMLAIVIAGLLSIMMTYPLIFSTQKLSKFAKRIAKGDLRPVRGHIVSKELSELGDVMNQVKDIKDTKLLAVKVEGVDMNGLRNLGDQLKEKLSEGVIVIASSQDGKVNLLAMATDGAMAKGAHAGNIVREAAKTTGGGGGGKPAMAQAGGKDVSKVMDALEAAKAVIRTQLA